MSGGIDYGNLMHRAMRGLIHDVLTDVAERGLPGDHHFFITFDTQYPDVELADWLSDRYPGEMTVVLQHRFDDLEVGEDGFAVTLSFGEAPERLYIPYHAIKTFVDPSVEFGLRFETQEDSEEEDEDEDDPTPPDGGPERPSDGQHDAEVVRLDAFRKP
ncbi:SspB family protein [Salipiger bermudensis]|uniref:SspB family protein n=1 Tax=Salipiger bermudensis TaxID=344736 RepID=UPI001CD46762|nr:ClpXP protease specificity-enhancing factor SspB [Salipiger bermudensis]MCA0960783.1 ClpXP protease specificity-enhancing factor SspB [Salipiger bermudensis]